MQHLLYKMTVLVDLKGEESVIKVAWAELVEQAPSAADATTATE